MKRRCIIGQSGGPTVAINATLAGVIEEAYKRDYEKVFGMVNGISGLLSEDFIELDIFKSKDQLNKLVHTPAMYLGSCRYKIDQNDQTVIKRIFDILEKYEINDFFYIGGNDSMDTIKRLSEYGKQINSDIHFIGLPKTIDNDLKHIEYTPGYPSACKYVANSLLEISFDSAIYPLKSVTIVEIMGRDAGWLTASAQLVNELYPCTIDLIYMPEIPFNQEQFIEDVRAKLMIKDTVVVAVSEGIRDQYGMTVSLDSGISMDAFGHYSNNGCSKYLKQLVSEKLKCKARHIELSTLQRCASHLCSEVDIENALCIGKYAVSMALKGNNGIMVSIYKNAKGFMLSYVSVDEVANQVREFPLNWINEKEHLINKEYIDYVVPLIYKSETIELPKYIRRYG